jgi:hypothetical protein
MKILLRISFVVILFNERSKISTYHFLGRPTILNLAKVVKEYFYLLNLMG